MKVRDPGVEAQEFLSAFPSCEALLTSLLSPCGSVFLLNEVVAAGRGDHLLVVDVNQARDLPDRGSVAAKLISVDDLWDIVFAQQPGQEGLRSFGVSVPLKKGCVALTGLTADGGQGWPKVRLPRPRQLTTSGTLVSGCFAWSWRRHWFGSDGGGW